MCQDVPSHTHAPSNPAHSTPVGGACNVSCAGGFSVAGSKALGYGSLTSKPWFQVWSKICAFPTPKLRVPPPYPLYLDLCLPA